MFIVGLIMAGVIGWISGRIVGSWNTIGRTSHRMFDFVPQPALRPMPASVNRGIGTEPTISPLQVLWDGCLTIIGQIIIQAMLVIVLGILIWFNFRLDMTQDFLVGIFFALVIGFLLQQLRNNWLHIAGLWSMIVNPPNPVLNPANPPNNRYLAASPPFPAFTVVLNNLIEISWRLIWQLILVSLLIQSFYAATSFLRDGTIQFLGLEAIGI